MWGFSIVFEAAEKDYYFVLKGVAVVVGTSVKCQLLIEQRLEDNNNKHLHQMDCILKRWTKTYKKSFINFYDPAKKVILSVQTLVLRYHRGEKKIETAL